MMGLLLDGTDILLGGLLNEYDKFINWVMYLYQFGYWMWIFNGLVSGCYMRKVLLKIKIFTLIIIDFMQKCMIKIGLSSLKFNL